MKQPEEQIAPLPPHLVGALKERLIDWTDFDVAGYQLGVVLGLLPEWPKGEAWGEHKWVFWSANPLGDALYEMLGDELKHRTTGEWLELLNQNDIPCMRPHTLETLLEDPHLADVGFFRFEEHPSEGRIRTMREPSTWSETTPPTGRFAPRLGQHTREILAEAGYTPAEIDALIAQCVVMTDRRPT